MGHVAAISNGRGTTTYVGPTYRYHQVHRALQKATVPHGTQDLREKTQHTKSQEHLPENLTPSLTISKGKYLATGRLVSRYLIRVLSAHIPWVVP